MAVKIPIHSLLKDLDIAVSPVDLKNPTETFVVNIISEFLNRFNIDVASINKATFEQCSALRVTNPENANIVSLINLGEAMAIFGKILFIEHFTINHLISPESKDVRQYLRLMANFALYRRNTMDAIGPRIDAVLVRGENINELRKKKQEIIEATNNKAAEIAQKKSNNDKLKSEIEITLKRNNKRISEMNKLKMQRESLEQQKQKIVEIHNAKLAEVNKLKEITEQLKSRVVEKPELVKQRLQELEEECDIKKEKRTSIQEAILRKKPMIQNLETALTFVKKQHAKLPEVIDLQKKLMEKNQLRESLKRQIEEITHEINLEATRDYEDEEKLSDNEIEKCEVECEKKLSKIRSHHNELMNKKKALETKRTNTEKRHLELRTELDKIRNTNIELKLESADFLRQCQELYMKEIKNMKMLHECSDEKLQSLLAQFPDKM